MRTPRQLLAVAAVVTLATAGCGVAVESGSSEGSGLTGDDGGAPPAAGACLEGATDCQDTGADMGAPPPDGDLPVADGDVPVSHEPDHPGPAAPTATSVEPVDGLEDVHPVGWEAVAVDPDDPSRVTLRWTSGVAPCNAFAGVEAAFTEDTVTLTVLEGTVPSDEPQACIELAQFKQATVELDEAIGPRSIIDGAAHSAPQDGVADQGPFGQ